MTSKPWPAEEVTRRAIAELTPADGNPRTHSSAQIDQLVASIEEWGWTIPILIDEDDQIIAGHGRVMAAEKMGLEEVPCMTARGWSKAQKRAYVIADNQLAVNAGWDEDLLKLEFEALGEMEFAIELTGFSTDAIRELLSPEAGEETSFH